MKVKLNPNKALVEEIRNGLKETGGYCPCSAIRTEDTKCMCKEFREHAKVGEMCHCQLYIKTEE